MIAFGVPIAGLSLDSTTIESLGWTLLHFLWQGSVVAALLALFDVMFSRGRPQLRYLAACAALVAMLALPALTFVFSGGPGARDARPALTEATGVAHLQRPSGVASAVRSRRSAPAIAPDRADRPRRDAVLLGDTRPRAPRRLVFEALDRFQIATLLPWMVGLWVTGVALLSIRLLGGWWLVSRLGRSVHNVPIEDWQDALARLAERMGVRSAVRLARSGLVTVPTAIGWLRPMILIPASTLTGLNPRQIEAILAHELAHIRRHDYLVNLVQSVVEILLFYHPAVWWVSRRIREERELCCDDLAVRACGDPVAYAKALCELERLRGEAVPMALAATGGSLVSRVAWLMGVSRRTHLEVARGLAWALIASLVLIGGAARSAVRVKDSAPVVKARAMAVSLAHPVVAATVDAPRKAKEMLAVAVAAAVPVSVAPVVASEVVAAVANAPEVAAAVATVSEMAARVAVASEAVALAVMDETTLASMRGPEVACEGKARQEAAGQRDHEAEFDTDSPGMEHRMSRRARVAATNFSPEDWERLSQAGVSPRYVANLQRAGYTDLSVDDLVSLANHGVSSSYAAKVRQALEEPTVEDLVKLANHGVSSRYVVSMRREIPDVSVDDLTQLANHGISTEYVAGMRRLDLEELGTEDLIRLANAGVTLDWFSALRWMGYADLTVERAIELRNAGVTPDFAASMRILNHEQITLDDLRQLQNQGVDVEYAAAMLGVLHKGLRVQDLVRLRQQGVTVNLVAALSALGYSNVGSDDLISMTQQGVDPEYVATIKSAGYQALPVRDLIRLKQSGVDGEFIEEVRAAGHGTPAIPELIRMRQRGIPQRSKHLP